MKTKKKRVPTIEIRKKKLEAGKLTTGAMCVLYINGKRIANATDFKLSIPARGVARATVELVGNISITEEK